MPCTPPRSMKSWLFTKNQTSSSPAKVNFSVPCGASESLPLVDRSRYLEGELGVILEAEVEVPAAAVPVTIASVIDWKERLLVLAAAPGHATRTWLEYS